MCIVLPQVEIVFEYKCESPQPDGAPALPESQSVRNPLSRSARAELAEGGVHPSSLMVGVPMHWCCVPVHEVRVWDLWLGFGSVGQAGWHSQPGRVVEFLKVGGACS